MIRIEKQNYEEKMAMYMKSSKKELAKMLINCNEIIDRMIKPSIYENKDPHQSNWTISYPNDHA